jgi:hypothetical protein
MIIKDKTLSTQLEILFMPGGQISEVVGVFENCDYAVTTVQGGTATIMINSGRSDEDQLISITHELNHACIRILKNLGLNVRPSNDEIFCRLHDFYFYEILRKFKIEVII